MSTLLSFSLVLFLGLCAIFILLIMIQKGRGGGISSAFGGAGGNTAFGSKTGDVLTWATSVVFFIFLVSCVILNWQASSVDAAYRRQNTPGATEAAATDAPAAATPAADATPAAAASEPATTLPAMPLPPSETPLPAAAAPTAAPAPAATAPVAP